MYLADKLDIHIKRAANSMVVFLMKKKSNNNNSLKLTKSAGVLTTISSFKCQIIDYAGFWLCGDMRRRSALSTPHAAHKHTTSEKN